MALSYTLTPDFSRAVDNLIQDAALSDSSLYSRAERYLDVFHYSDLKASHGSVHPGPAWAERIHKASPLLPPFTTPSFFSAMYGVADELGLVAGKRYVSAAVCLESTVHADLVRAELHQLSSTWAAFLLWPFYAHGREDRVRVSDDDLPEASPGDETPAAESIARAQRRRLKQQVLARDNSRCFVSGALDSSAYSFGTPLPPGVTRVTSCRAVPIIPPEVFAAPDASEGRDVLSGQDIMLSVLKGFCGVDAATLSEHAHGPANTLLMNRSAEDAFAMLVWSLHPTETPDRYELKTYDPVYNNGIGLGRPPVCTHVTFVDHTSVYRSAFESTSKSKSMCELGPVDLPAHTLLRAHAALAGVLHRSGAVDAFRVLRYVHDVPSGYGCSGSAYPASTGGAFWRSVVEYVGLEVCSERELGPGEAVEALRRFVANLIWPFSRLCGCQFCQSEFTSHTNRPKLGVEIFGRITQWLETNAIVRSKVVAIPAGLAGLAAEYERTLARNIGAKLVVCIDETL